MSDERFPIKVRALKVEQDLATFYAVVLDAATLLKVAYSEVMEARFDRENNAYTLEGTQREIQESRLREIRRYINRTDSAFPNSIILAANINESDGFFSSVESDGEGACAWEITEEDDGCWLSIPTPDKVAVIIDGQHRLFGFVGADNEKLGMQLLCAVYLDLPKPYQAQLFATINSNQKKVDKSLTYELFGYNISEEPFSYWSPDKLAVFLTRKLNLDSDSPFKGRIKLAPRADELIGQSSGFWRVSTATVVEGILRLVTSNPKRDADALSTPHSKTRSALQGLAKNDKSPFRTAYINGDDVLIYKAVVNFFSAVNSLLWEKAGLDSYIKKTIGIQALFDVMKAVSSYCIEHRDLSKDLFENILESAKELDFSSESYKQASGSGRTKIKQAILAKIDDKYKV